MTRFEELATTWAAAACEEWGYEPAAESWRETLLGRLPAGLQRAVVRAIDDGLATVDGHRFQVSSLGPGKGPYAFFSRSSKGIPAPNWEYFVQLAEFARVRRTLPADFRVGFEDGLMDVSVYDGDRLAWFIEVKEKARSLTSLVRDIQRHGRGVDHDLPDRHDDPLRKAKYLLRHRPDYFSAVAIGMRDDFSVEYSGDTFALTPDVVPLP